MLAVNTGFEEHSNYTDRVKRASLKTILAFVGLHFFICFMAVAFNVNGGSTRYMETHTLELVSKSLFAQFEECI